jgi:hypothetical protein
MNLLWVDGINVHFVAPCVELVCGSVGYAVFYTGFGVFMGAVEWSLIGLFVYLLVKRFNQKNVLEFFGSWLFSVVMAIAFALIHTWLSRWVELEVWIFRRDMVDVPFVLFIGVPAGAVLGITMVDKFILKSKRISILSLVLAVVFSEAAVIVNFYVLYQIGIRAIAMAWIPFVNSFFSVLGYNIGKTKKQESDSADSNLAIQPPD